MLLGSAFALCAACPAPAHGALHRAPPGCGPCGEQSAGAVLLYVKRPAKTRRCMSKPPAESFEFPGPCAPWRDRRGPLQRTGVGIRTII